jgi:predicted nucleic acid-binding protein
MSVRSFVDTNILIYALQQDAPEKQSRAHELLGSLAKPDAVISYQVVQEFCNAALRRFTPTPRAERMRSLVLSLFEQFEVVPWTPILVPSALEVHYRYQFQWYDSLIVAAALQAQCEVLYTEDLQHL